MTLDKSILRVSLEGDGAMALLPTAKYEFGRLHQRLEAAGIRTGRKVIPLGPSSYVVAIIAPGINICHVVATRGVQTRTNRIVEYTDYPDFISGFILPGRIEEVPPPPGLNAGPTYVCNSVYPTELSADLQNAFTQITGQMPLNANAPNRMSRFAIEPSDQFPELRADPRTNITYSQYTSLKPTMYSGRMRQVVQALMGFGKQNPRSIFSTVRSFEDTVENRQRRRATTEPSLYEEQVAGDGVVIAYDYRWARTHGIYKAEDDKLWLIEIGSTRGVLAMQLPLHRLTGTQRFKDRLEGLQGPDGQALNTDECLKMIEELGAFPTGEGFPDGAGDGSQGPLDDPLQAAINCGRVIRLLDKSAMAAWYDNYSDYSSAMGWAFSKSGKLAQNTGWRYKDNGLQEGIYSEVEFNIGESKNIQQDDGQLLGLQRKLVTILKKGSVAYFAENGGQTEEAREKKRMVYDSVIWVVENMLDADQLAEAIGNAGNPTDFFELFITDADEAVGSQVKPSANAQYHQIYKGDLFMPGMQFSGDQIKFPEPLVRQLWSHDGRPAVEDQSQFDGTSCDLPMHVFFIEETPQILKFYRVPDGEPGEQASSDAPPNGCDALVGTYTSTTETGIPTSHGFYSTALDERQDTYTNSVTVIRKGEDMGYTGAAMDYFSAFGITAELARWKTFRVETKTITDNDRTRSIAAAVPMFDREAYYYALHSYTASHTESWSYSDIEVGDPNKHASCAFDVVFAWFGGCLGDPCGGKLETGPNPNSYPAKVSASYYEETACGEMADEGPWLSLCQEADSVPYTVILPPAEPPELNSTAEEAKYKIWVHSSAIPVPEVVRNETVGGGAINQLMYQNAPDPDIPYLLMHTTSALGEAECTVYDIDINRPDARKIKGTATESMKPGFMATFIGVING